MSPKLQMNILSLDKPFRLKIEENSKGYVNPNNSRLSVSDDSDSIEKQIRINNISVTGKELINNDFQNNIERIKNNSDKNLKLPASTEKKIQINNILIQNRNSEFHSKNPFLNQTENDNKLNLDFPKETRNFSLLKKNWTVDDIQDAKDVNCFNMMQKPFIEQNDIILDNKNNKKVEINEIKSDTNHTLINDINLRENSEIDKIQDINITIAGKEVLNLIKKTNTNLNFQRNNDLKMNFASTYDNELISSYKKHNTINLSEASEKNKFFDTEDYNLNKKIRNHSRSNSPCSEKRKEKTRDDFDISRNEIKGKELNKIHIETSNFKNQYIHSYKDMFFKCFFDYNRENFLDKYQFLDLMHNLKIISKKEKNELGLKFGNKIWAMLNGPNLGKIKSVVIFRFLSILFGLESPLKYSKVSNNNNSMKKEVNKSTNISSKGFPFYYDNNDYFLINEKDLRNMQREYLDLFFTSISYNIRDAAYNLIFHLVTCMNKELQNKEYLDKIQIDKKEKIKESEIQEDHLIQNGNNKIKIVSFENAKNDSNVLTQKILLSKNFKQMNSPKLDLNENNSKLYNIEEKNLNKKLNIRSNSPNSTNNSCQDQRNTLIRNYTNTNLRDANLKGITQIKEKVL